MTDDADEWARIESLYGPRAQSLFTLLIVMRFSDLARSACFDAESNLDKSRAVRQSAIDIFVSLPENCSVDELRLARKKVEDADLSVVTHTSLASSALAYMMRTTSTLESAIRLHSMGRK